MIPWALWGSRLCKVEISSTSHRYETGVQRRKVTCPTSLRRDAVRPGFKIGSCPLLQSVFPFLHPAASPDRSSLPIKLPLTVSRAIFDSGTISPRRSQAHRMREHTERLWRVVTVTNGRCGGICKTWRTKGHLSRYLGTQPPLWADQLRVFHSAPALNVGLKCPRFEVYRWDICFKGLRRTGKVGPLFSWISSWAQDWKCT